MENCTAGEGVCKLSFRWKTVLLVKVCASCLSGGVVTVLLVKVCASCLSSGNCIAGEGVCMLSFKWKTCNCSLTPNFKCC